MPLMTICGESNMMLVRFNACMTFDLSHLSHLGCFFSYDHFESEIGGNVVNSIKLVAFFAELNSQGLASLPLLIL